MKPFSTSVSKDQRVVFKIFNTLVLLNQSRLWSLLLLPGVNPLVGTLWERGATRASEILEWSTRGWGQQLLPRPMEVCWYVTTSTIPPAQYQYSTATCHTWWSRALLHCWKTASKRKTVVIAQILNGSFEWKESERTSHPYLKRQSYK